MLIHNNADWNCWCSLNPSMWGLLQVLDDTVARWGTQLAKGRPAAVSDCAVTVLINISCKNFNVYFLNFFFYN